MNAQRLISIADDVYTLRAAPNPEPGSYRLQNVASLSAQKAGEEFNLAKVNAETSLYGGLAQSQSLEAGAGSAETFGLLSAASTAGMGYYRGQRVATPGAKE